MPAHFDRYDICAAYAAYHVSYSVGAYATGRRESYHGQSDSDIMVRLERMSYSHCGNGRYVDPVDLKRYEPNAYAIFLALARRKLAPEQLKPCLRCLDAIPIGRVVSRCDACIRRSRTS